ncbi:MAG: PAS domain S-box protein [Bacteroidia bacterium]|nr:PAS domain S-box protein [Bacteroidia bacterium]
MKEPTTVFIVEDEMLIAACLKDQLQESGFKILGSSARGEKSIEDIRMLAEKGQEPDIVLMDINLRGAMNGVDAARLITEQFNCAIIFLTGQSSREVYERSFFIKPFGYVLKPYDLEQMVMTIEIAAYQRKLEIENTEIRNRLENLLSEKTKENTEVLELYETIIENSLVGIWVLQNRRVIFANKAMADMLGYTLEEIRAFMDPELLNVFHPDDQDRLSDISIKRIQGEEIPQHTTFRIIRKNGEVRWMRSFVKRIQYQEKPALHQTFLDITEHENFNTGSNQSNI